MEYMEYEDVNVLALVKGKEKYIFLYLDACRADALRTLGKFAGNPELSFSWFDAAVLSQRIREKVVPEPLPDIPQPWIHERREELFERELFSVSNGEIEPITLNFDLPLKWDPDSEVEGRKAA